MILTLWKYLRGYVVIRVRGYAPERFINLCANKNIYIWNVRKISDGYIFSISGKAFFMLGPIAGKTKCRVKILHKIGLPFKFYKIKKRKFFLYGLIFSILCIIFLSFFVWRIEIEGNALYTTDEIVSYLERQNIKVGNLKSKINCTNLDDQLSMYFNQTMWVSSELVGTKLIIHMREGLDTTHTDINIQEPCDIVANRAGTIESIITRKGTPLVKKGDQVEVGAVLVSGTLEIKELTVLKAVDFTHSDADILIRTSQPYSDTLAMNYQEKKYIKEQTKKDRSLQLFSLKLNLLKPHIKASSFDLINVQNQIKITDTFYLPIYITTKTYLPYVEENKKYTFENAQSILKNNLMKHIKKLEENNIQILSNDVIFKEDGNNVVAGGSINVIEKCGEIKLFDSTLRRQGYNEYFTEEDGNTP